MRFFFAQSFFQLTDPCVNDAHSDFIYRFRSNKSHRPSKKDQSEDQLKPWFGNQIMTAIQRQDKLYKKFKHSGLETDQDYFKVVKMHLKKMILKKKKSYFEEKLDKNRN